LLFWWNRAAMAEQNTFKVPYNQRYEVERRLPSFDYASIIKDFSR